MDEKVRVVHYLNQFFAQIGGEDRGGVAPGVKEGPIGPGRALQQVVECRGDDSLLFLRGHVDQAQVGVARELGRRRLSDHPGEGLVCIELSIGVLQLGHRAFQVEVARGEDATRHRDEVRHESDPNIAVPAELARSRSAARLSSPPSRRMSDCAGPVRDKYRT